MSGNARERLGQRIRDERERLGWSQERLAKEATDASGGQIKLARSTLARQEAGEREPGVLEAVYIAQALGIALTALVAPDDDDVTVRAQHLLRDRSGVLQALEAAHQDRFMQQARLAVIAEQAKALIAEAERRGLPRVAEQLTRELSRIDEELSPFELSRIDEETSPF